MEDKYSMQPGQEHEPNQPDAEDVDALLQDVKSLLGESDGEAAEQPSAEDEPAPEESGGEPLSAEDVHIDYGKFYGPEEQKEPEAPLTFYEQSKPAYQRARRAESNASGNRNGLREPSVSRHLSRSAPPI